MNILRARGDRNHGAFGRDAFVADANPHRGARAIEVEYLGVAEVLDELHPGFEPVRGDPERAGTNADDDIVLASRPASPFSGGGRR